VKIPIPNTDYPLNWFFTLHFQINIWQLPSKNTSNQVPGGLLQSGICINSDCIKLNLSVALKLKSARDCYATTLKRAGVSKDNIGEMLGHSNSVVTEHYLASLDIEKTDEINRHIL